MCGIAALVYGDDAAAPADATRAVLEFAARCGLERRGPDGLDAAVPAPRVALAASVLRMRRTDDWRQPVVDGRGNALAWNGEWFDGDGAPAAGAGDTAAVAAMLGAAVAGLADAADAAAAVAAVLAGRVRGPYAVAFYAADAGALLFCRDPLGRRSLAFGPAERAFGVGVEAVVEHEIIKFGLGLHGASRLRATSPSARSARSCSPIE